MEAYEKVLVSVTERSKANHNSKTMSNILILITRVYRRIKINKDLVKHINVNS